MSQATGLSVTPTKKLEPKPKGTLPPLREGRFKADQATATEILERYPYHGQRRINHDHVARLASQMKHGVWMDGSQIAIAVKPTGDAFLVNGQHRLMALSKTNETVEFQMLVVHVANDEEIRALYHRFDAVQATRTDGAITRSSGVSETSGVGANMAGAVLRASVLIANGLTPTTRENTDPYYRTPDGKLEAAAPWWGQAKIYDDLTRRAETPLRRRLMNVPVLALGLVTLKHQEAIARTFWGGVADNDGLRVGDPRRTLFMTLIDRPFANASHEGLVITAAAWNAWYEKRKIQHLKVFATSVCRPLGTPYAK